MDDHGGIIKRLFILRHAKSSWDHPGLPDIDRPLNNRGKRDAPTMAQKLKSAGYRIQSIYLSPSQRTRLTSIPFIKEFNVSDSKVFLVPSLYHGGPEEFLEVINGFTNDDNDVMLIGHNPGITWLANQCSLPHPIDNVPTSGLLILETRINDWNDFRFEFANLKRFLYPKKFM